MKECEIGGTHSDADEEAVPLG